MDIVLAAPVWTFWISVALVVAGIGLVVALIVGYLYKVVMPRYPKR
jgi:hypothetical protein